MVRMEMAANVKLTYVPFKGGLPAITSVLGGHTDLAVSGDVVPFAKAGTIRPLAVLNPRRLPDFPDVPTLRELGIDVALENYMGVMAPAGVPRDRIEKLGKAFDKARKDPSFRENIIKKLSWVETYRTGDEVAKS
jgi:tripartite-type tricarboxylate transporter receptor subunit TctC